MGASELDQSAVLRHLEVAQSGLRRLDATTSTAVGDPAPNNVVHIAIKAAMNELDGAVRLLSAGELARIGCRFCGRMIMPTATLCGFCWRALSPTTSGQPR